MDRTVTTRQTYESLRDTLMQAVNLMAASSPMIKTEAYVTVIACIAETVAAIEEALRDLSTDPPSQS